MSDPRDLTGVWYGKWAGDGPAVMPGRFIAMLEEAGGTIGGMITEVDPASGGTSLLRAFVSGTRAGSDIRFLKQYDEGEVVHAVAYLGTLNADGTEIAGRWSFAAFSGDFVMERERFSIEELDESEEAELPLWIPMTGPAAG